MQRDAIKRMAKARGDKIAKWHEEKASSVNARPELTTLRESIRGGGVQKLYVFRLDRLSRGGILEVLNLVNEFRQHGCKLESVSDGFSLDGPAGDIVLAVFAWVAEMERAAIRARMAASRIQVEKAGGRWGRPRKIGAADVTRMKELQSKGRTVRSIAMALKIPRSTVSEYLSGKPTYKRAVESSTKSKLQLSGK